MSNESTNRAKLSDAEDQIDALDCADMERLASGHDAALNELMDRHAPRLFNYLIRCLQNEEDAADAAQEAFVRVYQNQSKFRVGQKFSTWLYAIATNLARDKKRWRARHPNVSLDAEVEASGSPLSDLVAHEKSSPSEELERMDNAEIVRKAVGELPEELRTPLILSEYEELSHAEIGEILECSAKAVETRIYRARNQLRGELSMILDDIAL